MCHSAHPGEAVTQSTHWSRVSSRQGRWSHGYRTELAADVRQEFFISLRVRAALESDWLCAGIFLACSEHHIKLERSDLSAWNNAIGA